MNTGSGPQPTDPATSSGTDDPGDDTFRRYRYQSTIAAILALEMLRPSAVTIAVFCEHHDDILTKNQSGKYHAIQVKTKQPGSELLKSSQTEIRDSLVKFMEHERQYGELFDRYTIATNHQFFRDSDNKSSLFFLKEQARAFDGSSNQIHAKLEAFIKTIAKRFVAKHDEVDEKAAQALAMTVLQKLHLDDGLPKFGDEQRLLREVIAEVRPTFDRVDELANAARSLSTMTYEASSLAEPDALALFLLLTEDPQEEEEIRVIDAKRISSEDVESALSSQKIAEATLAAADPVCPTDLPSDLSTAELKLAAGGLSRTTLESAKDWHASAEHLQRVWASKYGEERALERYNHVATIVQSACSEAHEASQQPDAAFGAQMLDKLREVIRNRMTTGDELFGSMEEHLLGHAVIRTDQCKVWWSEQFDLEGTRLDGSS